MHFWIRCCVTVMNFLYLTNIFHCGLLKYYHAASPTTLECDLYKLIAFFKKPIPSVFEKSQGAHGTTKKRRSGAINNV